MPSNRPTSTGDRRAAVISFVLGSIVLVGTLLFLGWIILLALSLALLANGYVRLQRAKRKDQEVHESRPEPPAGSEPGAPPRLSA
jgi:hypothetical protein